MTIEPVFYFPAWRVTCGGVDTPAFPDPTTGLLAHRGLDCTRRLVWTGPEWGGAALSLFALLVLLALSVRARPPVTRQAKSVSEEDPAPI